MPLAAIGTSRHDALKNVTTICHVITVQKVPGCASISNAYSAWKEQDPVRTKAATEAAPEERAEPGGMIMQAR